MPHTEELSFPEFVDERGGLVAVEFPDLPFVPVRAFMVRGAPGGAERGNHVVRGAQVLVLQCGIVAIRVGADEDSLGEARQLDVAGEAILLTDGSFIRYLLPDDHSSILVFCELGFLPRED